MYLVKYVIYTTEYCIIIDNLDDIDARIRLREPTNRYWISAIEIIEES